ncbi:unnamed protein product [Pylaiella littoralis]
MMATQRATAVPARETVLPLELEGISDERREQLELRRQREMARLQESQASTGNFRWSPIAMIPAHLCVLIFLIFLLEKLEGSLDWPWAAVLSPLWITDALFIVIKSKELRKILRTSVHVTSETYALFPPLGGIIDHLGVAAAKVTLAYRLEGNVDWSLLLLFTPMWICVMLAGTLRCITPSQPQVMGEQVLLHRAGSFFTGLFHLVARGAQPMLIVLKLDGQVDGPWSAVFVPLWVFMGAIALAGSALCCCAPMVSRGVIPEIRPLLIRGMLLCSVGTFSLTFCALLFLVFLTLDLNKTENFSARTILAPLIALYALILVFLPLLLLVTRHYVATMRTAEEHFRQANDPNGGGGGGGGADGSSRSFGVDVDNDDDDADAAGGRSAGGDGEVAGGGSSAIPGPGEGGGAERRRLRNNRGSSVMAPTILMRESSTLFRRASESLCRRLGEADGSYLDPDVSAFDLADWSRTSGASRVREPSGDIEEGVDGGGAALPPQRTCGSFDVLQEVSRRGKRLSAVVMGTSNREGHKRFWMSAGSSRSEMERSPRQAGEEEAAAKDTPEDDRHDQCLLPGDSGTHSVTDSFDLDSYGSYVDPDEENHEVGLSIDGDDGHDGGDGGGAPDATPHAPSVLPAAALPADILLGFGSVHGATAFSLRGGSGCGHGPSRTAAIAVAGGPGVGRHRWGSGHDTGRRRGGGGGLRAGVDGRMPRRLSWPGMMSSVPAPAKVGGGPEGPLRGDDGGAAVAAHGVETGGGCAGGGGSGLGLMAGQPTCYICCERTADAVAMECGHGGVCFTCATHLADTPPHTCPVCRLPIQEILKLHEIGEFGRVVAVPASEEAARGGGGGGGGGGVEATAVASLGGELKEPEDDARPACSGEAGVGSTTEASVAAAPGSEFANRTSGDGVVAATVAAGDARTRPRGGGGGGGRMGSGAFRRFCGPGVVGVSASATLAGASSSGLAAEARRCGDPANGDGGGVETTSQREFPASAAAGRRSTLVEAQSMCDEGGW